MEEIKHDIRDDLQCDVNCTSANEHERTAERNNRTLAAAIRSKFNDWPFKAVPRLMIEYLVKDQVKKINQFPAKGGVSDYHSPDILTGGRPLDYKRDFVAPSGAFVLAGNEAEPYNTNAPRMIEAIYLCPNYAPQGGHVLMNLNTGKKTTRIGCIKVLPMTDQVIKCVEALAHKQGIKELKIQNRDKSIFYPSDWLAGVDYEPENDDSDDERRRRR